MKNWKAFVVPVHQDSCNSLRLISAFSFLLLLHRSFPSLSSAFELITIEFTCKPINKIDLMTINRLKHKQYSKHTECTSQRSIERGQHLLIQFAVILCCLSVCLSVCVYLILCCPVSRWSLLFGRNGFCIKDPTFETDLKHQQADCR